ncbi:uncharacterized protein LOC133181816 isoform X2 [Saccostrea echinata]|uniref:uncharacterized protein LOC133175605 isoform X2 n=1 Tax=Saccostrea echinata TaxID=191078 RepID=UPI002A8282F8|nr:uncharacterized protein LOC133175605 isoform X2 [Saccostrea echinata]XP_061172421.1 uncharacterized protein LOC133181816 isoform X2 [Saccostrea echinata]
MPECKRLALHVFRAGVRRNNSDAILASRCMFSPLFFGLNMPFYMEAYIRDSMIRLQCPSEVSEFIANHESYSVSGNDSKGEGGDFVLENLNRKAKSFMPPGMPSEERWLTICRNIDRLDEIRQNMQGKLGMSEKDSNYNYTYDLTEEIASFRKIIRKSGYFQQTTLTTLSNKPTDSALSQFSTQCTHNKQLHYTHITTNKLSSRQKYTPIFILQEHRHKHTDISNKTKTEIISHIQTLIDDLGSDVLNKKWTKIKKSKKATILQFLKEINEIREGQNESESD